MEDVRKLNRGKSSALELVQPPANSHLGLITISMANDDVKLPPLAARNPVLRRVEHQAAFKVK